MRAGLVRRGRAGGLVEPPVGARRVREHGRPVADGHRRRHDGEGGRATHAHVARRVELSGLSRVGAGREGIRIACPRAAARRGRERLHRCPGRERPGVDRDRDRGTVPRGCSRAARERGSRVCRGARVGRCGERHQRRIAVARRAGRRVDVRADALGAERMVVDGHLVERGGEPVVRLGARAQGEVRRGHVDRPGQGAARPLRPVDEETHRRAVVAERHVAPRTRRGHAGPGDDLRRRPALPQPEAQGSVGHQAEQVLAVLAHDRRGRCREIGGPEPCLEGDAERAAQRGQAEHADGVVHPVELHRRVGVVTQRSRPAERHAVAIGAGRGSRLVDRDGPACLAVAPVGARLVGQHRSPVSDRRRRRRRLDGERHGRARARVAGAVGLPRLNGVVAVGERGRRVDAPRASAHRRAERLKRRAARARSGVHRDVDGGGIPGVRPGGAAEGRRGVLGRAAGRRLSEGHDGRGGVGRRRLRRVAMRDDSRRRQRASVDGHLVEHARKPVARAGARAEVERGGSRSRASPARTPPRA